MKYTIEKIMPHYGYLQIKLKGDKNWHFIDFNTLEGTEVDGIIVTKRTRTWFEKDIGIAEAIQRKDT